MNNTQQKNQKEELGALWKKKSKSGMPFLSGYVKVDDLGMEKEIKVVVFTNNKKTNDKAPDYRIYVSKPLESEAQTTSNSSEVISKNEVKQTVQNTKNEKAKSQEDDIEDVL